MCLCTRLFTRHERTGGWREKTDCRPRERPGLGGRLLSCHYIPLRNSTEFENLKFQTELPWFNEAIFAKVGGEDFMCGLALNFK